MFSKIIDWLIDPPAPAHCTFSNWRRRSVMVQFPVFPPVIIPDFGVKYSDTAPHRSCHALGAKYFLLSASTA